GGEEEDDPDRIPLDCEGEIREERRGRLVHRLEEPTAKRAEVDDRPAGEHAGRELAVDAPEPARLAEQIEAIRMLEVEERLRLAVPHLLLQVRLHGVAPVVPNGCRRAEADRVATVLETPADVHVVARRRVRRIEAADL